MLDLPRESQKIDDVVAHRNIFDSSYAALYHPWIEVFDPISKMKTAIPPSGSIAGIFAGSDNSSGVHKAPANKQDDINNGRLICVIGAAPVKPAEFVIFRITQRTSSEK